jgi:NAD(P)-dependent dehydrogenase (short-subunit alcohol dehydrogenase family)/rhamnose utilization protein RhaD (predicted bifunctional aldolase and dehydrogenase)
MKQEIKDLIEISQFYGSQKEFVIAGGGNTSWKDQNRLYIKASGINLGQITERGFCILDRRELAELPGKTYSEDGTIREEQVKIDLLASRLDPGSGLRPSVETLLHNLIDYPFVVHTHSTWVNGLMCSQQAAEVSEEIFGKEFLFVPYSDPGYTLFKRILQQVNAYKEQYRKCPQVILVQNHGIFVAANTTDEVHKIYDDVLGKIKNRMATSGETEWFPVSEKIVNILPGLRMLLSEGSLKTATAFSSSWIRPFLTDKETFEKGIGTPFTPDQLVYCGSEYLFLESAGSEVTVMKEAEMQIAAFRHRKGCLPKVLFIRGEGVVVAENSTVSLDYVKDIVNDFCQISKLSENFGGPHPLTGHQMRFIENWEFEHYRKKVFLGSNPQGKVENKIILVTGAAQGFGAGIAELLFREGANVIVADVNDEKGSLLVESLNRTETKNRALFVKANVAEDASVRNMVRQTVIRFGGLDAMISNAGILYAGSLDEMDPETFEQITRVNYNGFFLCAKYAQSVMKRQHAYKPERFMDIIQINSKSGLQGSKKNFAYAGSKFGGIGLTQSFALELMPFRIKVNAICPGNYFDGPLWSDPQNGLFVQYLEAGKVPGAASIDEVKAYYESQVPAGRGCTPEDVVKAIFYVMDQEYETGQAVPVTGGQNMLK